MRERGKSIKQSSVADLPSGFDVNRVRAALWWVWLSWLERWIVVQKSGGSNPLSHPIFSIIETHGPIAQLAEHRTLNPQVRRFDSWLAYNVKSHSLRPPSVGPWRVVFIVEPLKQRLVALVIG